MRPPGLLLAYLLILCIGGCSHTGSGGDSNSSSLAFAPTLAGKSSHRSLRATDSDGDLDAPGDGEQDDIGILQFGRALNSLTARPIEELVRGYYRDAEKEDGLGACSLLSPKLAESVPKDYGHSPGQPLMKGDTCGVVLAKLFALRHTHLAASTLAIVAVRVKGDDGIALLGSVQRPRKYLSLVRTNNGWKINELLYNEIL